MSMYVEDSTLYMLATILNKVLQLVLEWVARNKLVLNISKAKSNVFETNHALTSTKFCNECGI